VSDQQQRPWEIRVEREEGFTYRPGMVEPWVGWRVKYRPLGSRGRWLSFLTDDDLAKLSTEELQAVCSAAVRG
jgi:hypothetical protein